MLSRVVSNLSSVSPRARRFIWRHAYQALNRKFRELDWYFLNYGYESVATDTSPLILEERDEVDRYFIQLYHHVATSAGPLDGKKVLEVGSGRGGGASYVARYVKPASLVGVDRSERAIEFSRKFHNVPNLSFQRGDAESLPFENEEFDTVINVESSHCYGSMPRFVREVRRVLRPGGHFLWTDFREQHRISDLDRAFHDASLPPFKKEDITENVIKALDLIHERKSAAIHMHVPKLFVPSLLEFAGVKGSAIYDHFQQGSKRYLHYASRK